MAARAAILLLAVFIASAAAQINKISLDKTSLTLRKDSSELVTFRLNEPIICPDQGSLNECAVVVEIDNQNPSKVAIDNCIVKWMWNEWAQPRMLRVTAVENFINEGSLSFRLVTKPAISASAYYRGFDPADITLTTVPRPSGACSGSGDPHYTTFDGLYWHVYQAGTSVLYSNRNADNNLDFEIQVATRGYPAVHCGFAAKEGNDIFVMSFCNGGTVHRRSCGTVQCQNGGFPKVSISGSSYTVVFASGRRMSASGSSFSCNAPGRDYQDNVQGICGNFDGNRNNDSPCGGCTIGNLAQLLDGQKAKRDLFNWYPTSIVNPQPAPPHVQECTYIPPSFRPPILTHPDPEDITNLLKDVVRPEDREPIVFDFSNDGGQPLGERMEHADAYDLCHHTIENSAVARACKAVLPDFSTLDFIQDCTEDLAESSDRAFIADAIDALQVRCAALVAAGDTSDWETDHDGNPVPPSELLNNLCPSTLDAAGDPQVCSGRGTCNHLVCTCEDGYTGADCAVNKALPPTARSVTMPFCDVRSGKGCGTPKDGHGVLINVLTTNAWNSPNLKCRFSDADYTVIMDAFFMGSAEVLCAVPPMHLTDFQPRTMTVQVTTDGTTYGSSTATFTWYDGICDVCTIANGCAPNPESCTIDGECYLRTQPSSTNICLQCLPDVSTTAWSYSYDNHVECGPSFHNGFLTARVVGEATAGQVFYTVNGNNPLVLHDPNYRLTYSLLNSEPVFSINAQGGISTSQTLRPGAQPQSFNYLIHVNAVDQSGNHAQVSVILEFVSVNSAPIFSEDGYAFSVAENSPIGTVVGQVTAEDLDEEFGTLSYRWYGVEQGYENHFAVDEATGVITVRGALDFETKSSFVLNLRAVDNGGQYHTTVVTISITDVPEAPTAIFLTPSKVKENMPAGTVVGVLTATDPEGGAHTFTVTGNNFAVTGTNLVTARALDFESSGGSVTVSVTARDSTSLTYTQTIVVVIEDVNEPPKNVRLANTVFSESSAPSTRLTEVLFDDDDNSVDPFRQIVRCTVTEDVNGYFEISQNGLILLKKLDFETQPAPQLTVVCADDGEPTGISDPETFTITVVDANDAPEDVRFLSTAPVPEDHNPAVPVGTLSAKDYDADATFITFSLNSDRFVMVGTAACGMVSGVLTCTQDVKLAPGKTLDFETYPVENIEVVAFDGIAESVTIVQLSVSDVNEPPTGVQWVGANSIPEDAQVGDIVGQLVAIDEDHNQLFTFELLDNNHVFGLEAPSRRRDSVSGVMAVNVVLKGTLNFEVQDSYTLTLKVTDNGVPALSVTTQAVVAVTDEPVRVFAGAVGVTSVAVDENMPVGTVVTQLVMTGDDRRGAPFNLAYTLTLTDNSGGHFVLDGNVVKVARVLDHEEAAVRPFQVMVTVSGSGALPTPTQFFSTIQVHVNDLPEAPVFAHAAYTITVSDDAATGQTQTVSPAAVSAVAPDAGASAVTYSIDTVASHASMVAAFDIHPDTGAIRTKTSLTGVVVAGTFPLVVRASADGLSSSVTVTVTVVDNCANNACRDSELCVDGAFTYTCCATNGVCISEADALARQEASGSGNAASTGMIAGILVAVVALVVLIAIIVIRRRQRQQDRDSLFKNQDSSVYMANPTYRAPSDGPQYATVNPHFVPGVSNPMYEWYRPDMTRQECTELLMEADDGQFVVRDSKATPGWHMLGVKASARQVVHEKIKMNEDGTYELLPASNARQPRFNDVPALINYYGEPRPDVPYVLSVSFSNPMYAMGGQPGNYHYAPGTALPNDPAAPMVPLKDAQRDTVAQLAATDSDLYGNANDARIAIGSDV